MAMPLKVGPRWRRPLQARLGVLQSGTCEADGTARVHISVNNYVNVPRRWTAMLKHDGSRAVGVRTVVDGILEPLRESGLVAHLGVVLPVCLRCAQRLSGLQASTCAQLSKHAMLCVYLHVRGGDTMRLCY